MTLRVIPIGGLGEFGMNLMLYELEDSAIVVDCGMMFPDARTPGVDVIIPDMSYLLEKGSKIKAIFLTHGHEDHIGAIPFLAPQLRVPVYGRPLTLEFVRGKLEEFGSVEAVELVEIRPRENVVAGAFSVEAIHVTHSIVDAAAYAISTPLGTVIHTGDFKFDETPVAGETSDLETLSRYGEKGVLLLVSDSTNATTRGFTGSESVVGSALTEIFLKVRGRAVVTTFASHLHRIQQVIDSAKRAGRVVHMIGRSLVENVEVAERLGYLHFPRDVRPSGRPSDDDPASTVIITTGSQGEPNSALSRMARGQHRDVHLEAGDTVVISARTIPGNEKSVTHLMDNLFRLGADVIYDEVPNIHVSGHASQEELRALLNLTRPRNFIPMHGNLRSLIHHARLAQDAGVDKHSIFVVTNGEIVEFDEKGAHILEERAPAGKVFIDSQSEAVPDLVVRDRQHLAEDGFVIVVAVLDVNSGKLARDPEIITRGLLHVDASGNVLEEVRDLLVDLFESSAPQDVRDAESMQERMRAAMKRYFRKKLNRRPMILPVVWEM